MDLAKSQVALFQKDNTTWMDLLITSDCIRGIMFTAYNSLVRDRKIKAIEDMEQGDKENIWLSAKEFAKDRLNDEQLIELSKGLVSLEYLLEA